MGFWSKFKKRKLSKQELMQWQEILYPNEKKLRLSESQLRTFSCEKAENLFKIINESAEIANTTKNIGIFFSRYQLLIEHLSYLALLEPYISFTGKPSDNLSKIKADEINIINNLIDRVFNDINTLKTERGRKNRILKLKEELLTYQQYLHEENTSYFASKCEKANLSNLPDLEIAKTKQKQLDLPKLVTQLPIDKSEPGTFEWVITVSFGKTTSKNLQNAVFIAQKGRNFKCEEIDNSKIYTVEYSDSREDFNNFIMLYDIVGNWKSTAFFINGEMVNKKIVSEIKWCYGDKCNSIKSDFCYGASDYTENPFGCHRLQISSYNNPWWTYYHKNGVMYILDKESLIDRINRTYNNFKYCPAFNLKNITNIANSLPLSINEVEYSRLKSAVEKHLGYFYE